MADDRRFHAARLVLSLRQAGVTQHLLTEAMERTPREAFVPRPFAEDAWENVELPIDCGQTMLRPVMVGQMLAALDLRREHTVLEIGTGSGYSAAVMSSLVRRVYTVDRFRTLVDRARSALASLSIASRVEIRLADGLMGWPEAAPFDRILLTGSVPSLPEDLGRQLSAGGIAVLPVQREGAGHLMRLQKLGDGTLQETTVCLANFSPLQPGVAREL